MSAPSALLAAIKSTAITAGLAFPLLAFRTHPDFSNKLVLAPRWSWFFIAVALAFALRLASAFAPERAPAKSAATQSNGAGKAFVWAGLAALILWPMAIVLLLGPDAARKWVDNYGVQILIYILLGWGLNIVVGLAGLLDLGYVGFYGIGAYTYALLSLHYDFSFWLCLPIAALIAAFWGVILGFPVLRLRGDYLAIVTLAFGEIIRVVLVNFDVLTKGDAGIGNFAELTFFGLPFKAGPGGFAAKFGLEHSPVYSLLFLYYVVLAAALLVNFITLRLRKQPLGRAWEALREDEIACRALGLNTTIVKLTAFALGAAFAGVAGVFFATRMNYVTPSSFTFNESALILAIVVLGGRGSQIGVAIAAVVLIAGAELPRELDVLKQWLGNDFEPAQARMLLVGLAMVFVINWRPRGLVATRAPTVTLGDVRAVSADFATEGRG